LINHLAVEPAISPTSNYTDTGFGTTRLQRRGSNKGGPMKTKCDKFLLIVTIILIIAAFVYIIYPASKKIIYNARHVMTQEQKEVLFTRIGSKIFTGKDGRRPFIVVRDTRGKLEVYNEDRKQWIRI
jgi:hypothetical protein